MRNTFAIIRNLLFGSLALLLISTSNFGAPLVRPAGANTTDIALMTAFFRQDFGGAINAAGNTSRSAAPSNEQKIWRNL